MIIIIIVIKCFSSTSKEYVLKVADPNCIKDLCPVCKIIMNKIQ